MKTNIVKISRLKSALLILCSTLIAFIISMLNPHLKSAELGGLANIFFPWMAGLLGLIIFFFFSIINKKYNIVYLIFACCLIIFFGIWLFLLD